MAVLLVVLLLADPLADAKALRDDRGVAAFEEIFALAVAAQGGRERQGILDVLVSLGPDAVPFVVAKTQRKPPPPRVRECAFMTLQKLAGRDEAAAAVVPLLVHPDSAVRRVVRDALKRESVIPVVLAALRGADAGLRNELRAVLKAQGEALRPHLAPLLDDPDPEFRVQLVPLLAGAGDLETLVAWARDRRFFAVRLQAVTELGRHVKSPALVVPALRRALADRSGRVRLAAVRGLANFPAQAADFVTDVGRIALIGEGHPGVAAVRTLLAAGAPGRPFLERALQALNVHVRLRTVEALGVHGGEDVVPLLERAAGRDESPWVRRVAVEALGRWPRSVAALERAAGDSDGDVRAAAVEALGDLGPKAASAAPTVGKLVTLPRHRRAVLETLAAMGPDALPAFLDVVRELPPDQAWQGVSLWGAKTTVPALAKLLAEPPPERRRSAAWALGCFGAKAAPAVPALIRLVGDKDRIVAGQAIWALGEIGPPAKAAVPALKARLDDAALRPLVRAALESISAGS